MATNKANQILITDPLWNDTGTLQVMPMRTFFIQTADGTVGNSASELSLDSTGVGTKTVPVSWWAVGRGLYLKANGTIANTGTPTLTIKFKLGSTVISATAANSTVAITGTTNWYVEVLMTCRTTGGSATSKAIGAFEYFSTGLVNAQFDMTDQAATFNSAATQAITLTAQWGTLNAANTMTCNNLLIAGFGV